MKEWKEKECSHCKTSISPAFVCGEERDVLPEEATAVEYSCPCGGWLLIIPIGYGKKGPPAYKNREAKGYHTKG